MMTGISIIGVLTFFLFPLLLFIAHIALCIWAYRDAIRIGRSREFALLALVALLFFPVIGFIVYLIIRHE